MIDRLGIGKRAERKAERYLKSRGLRTLQRNFRCRGGELDLIAEEQDTIVVVEVRQRRRSKFGNAADTVDQHKQRKLIYATTVMLSQHPEWSDRPVRFDVVGIDNDEVTWIRDAFDA